jgi:hypothetical protein
MSVSTTAACEAAIPGLPVTKPISAYIGDNVCLRWVPQAVKSQDARPHSSIGIPIFALLSPLSAFLGVGPLENQAILSTLR